jgi:hypothetical protein
MERFFRGDGCLGEEEKPAEGRLRLREGGDG